MTEVMSDLSGLDTGPNRLVNGLSAVGAAAIFGTSETTDRYFEETSYEVAERQFRWLHRLALGETVAGSKEMLDGSYQGFVVDAVDHDRNEEALSNTEISYVAPSRVRARGMMQGIYETAGDLQDRNDAGLLLRLGIYLTHAYGDGHTRGGAIVEALRTIGYNGSDIDNLLYAQLSRDGEAVACAGRKIDVERLLYLFSVGEHKATAEHYGLGGYMPQGVAPFVLGDLADHVRTEHHSNAVLTARLLADRYFGALMATHYGMARGTMVNFLMRDDSDRVVIDSQAFARTLRGDHDTMTLLDISDALKARMIKTLSHSFAGYTQEFGDALTIRKVVSGLSLNCI